MNSSFGLATVCGPGYRANPKWRRKRGQRQCLKEKAPKISLKELQELARANEVSIYKRRKDDMGFTRTPLTVKALKLRLSRMKVPYRQGVTPPVVQGIPIFGGMDFGMATVCRPGYSANPNWKRGRGQRQCLKDKVKKALKKAAAKKAKPTLKELQTLARANEVSIYKRRKDDMGFTRTPLTVKALKLRLTKMKVPYA
jgi:uncharacterized protein YehS (DUF1456 family)